MNIFLSWSGERSKIVASELVNWLPRILTPLKPWMSDRNIHKGDRWREALKNSLAEHSVGIICVTPENQNAPWPLFEAGALSNSLGSSCVVPLLIGMETRDLLPPLNQFQSTILEKNDMYLLIKRFNELLGNLKLSAKILEEEFFIEKWPKLEKSIEEKLSKVKIPLAVTTLPSVLDALVTSGFPKPNLGSTAHFKEGFESHSLYSAITDVAEKRLYILGRKNRKFFDKEHFDFFKRLQKFVKQGELFDLRVLSLSPDAPPDVIEASHIDLDFKKQLIICQNNSKKIMKKFQLEVDKYIRTYSIKRDFAIVVVDDAILFTPIEFTDAGQATALTKNPFTITDINTNLGNCMLQRFLATWNNAIPLK